MYKEREILFNNPRTDWSKIQELEYLLQPYYHMWIGLINSNLKDRLWEEITKKTGINQTPHEGFTFQNILDQGMIKHLEIYSEVVEKAYREAKIEE